MDTPSTGRFGRGGRGRLSAQGRFGQAVVERPEGRIQLRHDARIAQLAVGAGAGGQSQAQSPDRRGGVPGGFLTTLFFFAQSAVISQVAARCAQKTFHLGGVHATGQGGQTNFAAAQGRTGGQGQGQRRPVRREVDRQGRKIKNVHGDGVLGNNFAVFLAGILAQVQAQSLQQIPAGHGCGPAFPAASTRWR